MTISATGFTPFSSFGSGVATAANATSTATSTDATSNDSSATSNASSVTSSGGVDTLDSSTGSAYNLSTDDFMKLFLAQLENQDPTKPVDDSQMLSELGQMTQVSTLQEVQKSLAGSQLSTASALIGKNVTGTDVNNAAVSGVVTSVVQSSDAGLVLQVGSQYIKPDSVTTVTTPASTGTTGTTS